MEHLDGWTRWASRSKFQPFVKSRLAPGQALVSLSNFTRPLMVAVDPAPVRRLLVECLQKARAQRRAVRSS